LKASVATATANLQFSISPKCSHVVTVTDLGNKFDYDVAIVGGGSGGYAAARTAGSAGLRTVVIDGG